MSLKRMFREDILKFRLWLSRDWSYEGVELKRETVEETAFKKKVRSGFYRVYKNRETGEEKKVSTRSGSSSELWQYKQEAFSMTMEEPIMT